MEGKIDIVIKIDGVKLNPYENDDGLTNLALGMKNVFGFYKIQCFDIRGRFA